MHSVKAREVEVLVLRKGRIRPRSSAFKLPLHVQENIKELYCVEFISAGVILASLFAVWCAGDQPYLCRQP